MKQILFPLYSQYQLPVIRLIKNNLLVLLDTGAYFPVWSGSEKSLMSILDAKPTDIVVPLSGFSETVMCRVYEIDFVFGELIYPHMPIAVNPKMKSVYHMIISATMLEGLKYEVDTVRHTLDITVPDNESIVRNLKILSSDGELHIFVNVTPFHDENKTHGELLY